MGHVESTLCAVQRWRGTASGAWPLGLGLSEVSASVRTTAGISLRLIDFSVHNGRRSSRRVAPCHLQEP